MKPKNKKIVKTTTKIIAFILIANLPLITATSLIGLDPFLDSFENPNSYLYLRGIGVSMEPNIKDGDYIVLQKSSHPDFTITEGDVILYFQDNGKATCHRVYHITAIGSVKRYHTAGDSNYFADPPVYENQIVGKVVKTVDDNPWNLFAIKIWDITINNLNIKELIWN